MNKAPQSWRIALASGVAFALHVAILAALVVQTRPWATGDSSRYLALADAIRSGRGFGLETGPAFTPEGWRLPGYPAMVAASYGLFGPSHLGLVSLQAVLFLAAVGLVWRFTARAFDERTGLIFLYLSAAYPFIAYYSGQIGAEIPSVFLIAAAFFCLRQSGVPHAALAGAILGTTCYLRPNMLPVIVSIAVALIASGGRARRRGLTMIATAVLVVTPWAFRNYRVFGEFTPMPVFKGTGTSLLLATWQARVPTQSLVVYGMTGRANDQLERSGMMKQVRALNREIGVPQDTIFVTLESYPDNWTKARADRVLTRAALENIRCWPGAYLRSTALNTFRLWFSAYLPSKLPATIRFVLLAEGVLATFLGFVGVFLAIVNRTELGESAPAVLAAASAMLCLSLTLCWFHTEARYTISARLLLLSFAAYAVARVNRGHHRITVAAKSSGNFQAPAN